MSHSHFTLSDRIRIQQGIESEKSNRWKQKWLEINKYRQTDNPNRPTRPVGTSRLLAFRWSISTSSSALHHSPQAIREPIIDRILELRTSLKRCAEVIWYHLNHIDEIKVSLSSVHRILRRYHQYDGARKNRVRYDNPKRPHPTAPGELVQTDTIHHVDPKTGRRLYYYTVIDLFTRMAYVKISTRLRQGLAVEAVLKARHQWGFPIAMVQSDNGPEYGKYFEQYMKRADIQTRHSRLHRPNDNAHIERFNRTIQTECIGYYWNRNVLLQSQQAKLSAWLEYYNTQRVHLGIQLKTPASMLQRS